METLPVDVIPDIAQHLSAKDLAACCAVSIWWRDAFGTDEVWKGRCDVNMEEYLRSTPCRVEPKFATPESEGTTLSPIGRWRIAYMREVHLRRNWINGNCVEDTFIVPPGCHGIRFFKNDLLIHMRGNTVELRDASANPSICVAQCEIPFKYPLYRLKVVRGDTIIIWDTCKTGNMVQVIHVNTETYTLSEKLRFIVSGNCEMRLCSFVLVNNVFLANDNYRMYIGNFENGTTLKTESNPQSGGYLRRIDSYENCEDVVVTTEDFSGNHHYFIYNVNEFRFVEFTQTRESPGNDDLCSAIVNNFFALFSYEGELDVYDYHTSCLIYHAQLPKSFYSNRILGDSLIFITKEKKLMQLSLSTRKVRCLHTGISEVEYIDANHADCRLLLIKRGNETCNVWMVGPEPLVFTPKVNEWEIASANRTLSKMLITKPDTDHGQWTVLDLW